MRGLKVEDYGEVEDLLFELLSEKYGVEEYEFDDLKEEVVYAVGTVNIVKLGDTPNTLKHKYNGSWSKDIEVTDSYRYASYYKYDALQSLCDNHLTGKWSESYACRKMNSMMKETEKLVKEYKTLEVVWNNGVEAGHKITKEEEIIILLEKNHGLETFEIINALDREELYGRSITIEIKE